LIYTFYYLLYICFDVTVLVTDFYGFWQTSHHGLFQSGGGEEEHFNNIWLPFFSVGNEESDCFTFPFFKKITTYWHFYNLTKFFFCANIRLTSLIYSLVLYILYYILYYDWVTEKSFVSRNAFNSLYLLNFSFCMCQPTFIYLYRSFF